MNTADIIEVYSLRAMFAEKTKLLFIKIKIEKKESASNETVRIFASAISIIDTRSFLTVARLTP